MRNITRRSMSVALVFNLFAPAVTLAAKMGVVIRFLISEQRSSGERRTYQNSVLMKYDESFAADIDGQFNVSLRTTPSEVGVNVEISVHDLQRSRAFAGKATAAVSLDGRETVVELSKSTEATYSVTLSASKRALPEGVA